jgi:hypothetical protein
MTSQVMTMNGTLEAVAALPAKTSTSRSCDDKECRPTVKVATIAAGDGRDRVVVVVDSDRRLLNLGSARGRMPGGESPGLGCEVQRVRRT